MEGSAAATGNRSEFESLLIPVLELAYRVAARLTNNSEEAIDLVQDASVQAFRRFHLFESGTNFKAWFLKILTNRFLKDKEKENRRGKPLSLDDTEGFYLADLANQAGGLDPAAEVFDKFDSQSVQEALDKLPEEYRLACTLFFLNEMSYEQIAEMLEIPVGTVRSRIHRGRKLLQRALWSVAEGRGLITTENNV